ENAADQRVLARDVLEVEFTKHRRANVFAGRFRPTKATWTRINNGTLEVRVGRTIDVRPHDIDPDGGRVVVHEIRLTEVTFLKVVSELKAQLVVEEGLPKGGVEGI